MSSQEIPGWVKRVQDRAIGFAGHVTNRFRESVEYSLAIVPKDVVKDQAHVVLDSFLDAFVGSVAMVATQYAGNTGVELEEAIIHGFRYKFREMRKASLSSEGREMEKAPIQKGDLV